MGIVSRVKVSSFVGRSGTDVIMSCSLAKPISPVGILDNRVLPTLGLFRSTIDT